MLECDVETEISSEQIRCLVGALEAESALPTLEVLHLGGGESLDVIQIFTEALGRGAVSKLKTLWINGGNVEDNFFEAFIVVLEDRKRHHCVGLQEFDFGGWQECDEALRIRFLRASLPSIRDIMLHWE